MHDKLTWRNFAITFWNKNKIIILTNKKIIIMSIKGTETEKNLLKSFAGESQAKNRYTFFAKQAKKEGYEQIAALFAETAMQEEQHAKVFFKFLEGGMVEITAMYPAGVIGTTAENLEASANGEHEEWADLYPEFARIAEKEGFPKIATAYKLISKVEAEHENRYRKLLENVKKNQVFEREEEQVWVCRNCGYHHKGKKALENCPCCDHPKAHFELKAMNY
ncbi:MAG: Rubrerythrin [Bacteroidetes bacterium]|nr:Rubrerythrin [Bacteroidota bacterium]